MTQVYDMDWLIGEVITQIERVGDDELHFMLENGRKYRMYHRQDCCESVDIEDIIGDLDDLIGSTVTMAEEVTESGTAKYDWDESHTWTFYKFATAKGYVTIRWYGTSNGYYSESVDIEEVHE